MAAAAAPLRYRGLWLALGWVFVACVIYLSLTANPPRIPIPNAYDIGHLLSYFWLMIWFAQIHRRRGQRLAIAAMLCALGIALEFIQGMTGYRMFDYADMTLDVAGVAVGLLLARTAAQDGLHALERKLARR
ncbi:MAG: VanZ family protein [Burkholderiales bacterium]|nr:VanZ family protein [Burkholderiales bacterium]